MIETIGKGLWWGIGAIALTIIYSSLTEDARDKVNDVLAGTVVVLIVVLVVILILTVFALVAGLIICGGICQPG